MARIIRDYFANSSMITWYENDNTDQTQGTSDILSSNEDLTFTVETWVQGEKAVTFSAPNIKMESLIAIHNVDGNSITFENSVVNFDKATWYDDPIGQGKIIFSGDSKLNLTSESNKLLIICNDISGTITLDLDDSFVSGSTFSIQANSANNLIINNAEGYEVIPTTDGTITTYTVNRVSSAKEIKQITLGEETYLLKDETARNELSGKQDIISDLAEIRQGAALGETAVQPETLNNFVTTNTEQTINTKKIFSFTEPVVWAGQESILKILSTHTNSELTEPMWSGRITIGNKNKTFLMGVYHQDGSDTPMCGLGAHRWSNSFTDSGAAWEDVYIQPDGNTSVYIGGYNWTANSGWLRIKNSGAGSSSYKIAINTGTATSPVWRNVLPNQSTGSNSVLIKNSVASSFNYSYSTSINGTVTSNYGASFGYGSSAGNYGVALGSSAIASASYAIQLGKGTNSTANTFNVGLSSSLNVQLLNSSGKIPIDRIDLTQITGYDSSVAQTLKHTADGEIQWVND